MKLVSRRNPHKFVQYAERVWGVGTPDEAIACFEKFLKEIGMPSSMTEFGAKESDIPMFIEHMGLTDEATFGGYVKLNAQDVAEIYRLAL
jgi:hypothetical protein